MISVCRYLLAPHTLYIPFYNTLNGSKFFLVKRVFKNYVILKNADMAAILNQKKYQVLIGYA